MSHALPKIERVRAALEHREPDRVPIGEFFWTGFVRRARNELGRADFDPYRYWDLDLVVINPNMDPHISGIRVLEDGPERKVLETGFGATIEWHASCPMPVYRSFATQTYEEIQGLYFDDPRDARRFTSAVDDQINCITDAINLGLPSFLDRVRSYAEDFCVFGSICEPHEMLWRIIGTENALLKMAERPAAVATFIERIGDFLARLLEREIELAGRYLTGIYIWGDVAYRRGMFFSPVFWRRVYKPQVARLCRIAHTAGLKTIYHGCGNATPIYEDLMDAGVDAYNPLEAKAGLDVVELKRQFGGRWAFNGNVDVRVLGTNDRDQIRREVLRKLNAARGGGYIVQSDHSVPDDVSAASYDYLVQLVREYGTYPLRLGEYEESLQGTRAVR